MIPLDTWLRSDSPQKLGYDAVMPLSTGVIRFIQTSVAREHDLNMVSLSDLVSPWGLCCIDTTSPRGEPPGGA